MGELRIKDNLEEDPKLAEAIDYMGELYQRAAYPGDLTDEDMIELDAINNVLEQLYRLADLG